MKTIIQHHIETGILTIAVVVAAIFFGLPALTHASTISGYLIVGSTGADVTALQTFLAQDPTIYPRGLVTGYYGALTESAVANFQTRNGIDPAGVVGPLTLPVLNRQMTSGMVMGNGAQSTSVISAGLVGQLSAPAITGVSVSTGNVSATVSWYTNLSSKGAVYISTSPLSLSENVNTVNISGSAYATDGSYRTNQNILIQGLLANTLYYYSVYSIAQSGNSSVSWPATFRTTN